MELVDDCAYHRLDKVCSELAGEQTKDLGRIQGSVVCSILVLLPTLHTSIVLMFLCSSETVWDLNDEELSIWESLLKYVMNLAEDDGMDIIHEVDSIACTIQQKCNPTFTSLVRIADMLITSVLESSRNAVFQEITELPDNLVDFIADTLNQSYPPSPSTGFSSAWMIRSIQWLLNSCPDHLYLDLLETLQESVVRWISDEQSALVDCYDDVSSSLSGFTIRVLGTEAGLVLFRLQRCTKTFL